MESFRRLGLDAHATLKEAKCSYRKLALLKHPDNNLGLCEDFRQLLKDWLTVKRIIEKRRTFIFDKETASEEISEETEDFETFVEIEIEKVKQKLFTKKEIQLEFVLRLTTEDFATFRIFLESKQQKVDVKRRNDLIEVKTNNKKVAREIIEFVCSEEKLSLLYIGFEINEIELEIKKDDYLKKRDYYLAQEGV